jgi:DNA-binding response OmpR family regulator
VPREYPTILVVDDDVDTCRNLADILSDMGYQVDTAHDGPSALQLVQQRPYDVALLDYKMPGMTGLELYRAIRKLRAATVAIVVTAYLSERTAEEALEVGAWRTLAKPVDFSQLLPLVNEALEQPLVLIVDDDPDLCSTLWDLLRERGYRVSLAQTESEARLQVGSATFQAVLIDMKLPQGDGAGVFRLVRHTNPKARTILITGHRSEMDEVIQQILAEGADAVCYKPFDVPKLLALLENFTQTQPPA